MAKHRLKLYDFDQDYLLIGIHSNSEIYKLAYEINSVLKFSLKREKDEASEVKSGTECGISIKEFNDFEVGDFIEVFSIEEIAQSL